MITARNHGAAGVVPEAASAGSFVQSLAAQDFAELGGALAAGACLRALLPSGLWEWAGAEAIAHRFARWFGDTEDYEFMDGAVGEVGGRLHLHWRLRLRAARLGAGWFTVEQLVVAGHDTTARLEAKVAFETLLGRYPGLRLAVSRNALAWAHGDGLVLRGLLSLPVALGPARRHG